jgi:hypothetical protein
MLALSCLASCAGDSYTRIWPLVDKYHEIRRCFDNDDPKNIRVLRGCEVVTLHVHPERETAHRLYVSRGFSQRQYLRDYYLPGQDAVYMTLDVLGAE